MNPALPRFFESTLVVFWVFAVMSLGHPAAKAEGHDRSGCSRVDLRTAKCPSGEPRLPPLRDQGATNYCYAFSLADYYSFVSCKNFSGLYVGLRSNLVFAQHNPNGAKAGGTVKKNLNEAAGLNSGMSIPMAHEQMQRARGLCLESDFRSDRRQIMSESAMASFLNEVWTKRNDRSSLNCPLQRIPDITWTTAAERGRSAAQAIHASLDRGAPAIINFSGDIVTNPRARGARPDHIGMIVGRRMHNGRCQLLVRDPTPITRTPWGNDQGYVWIPEETMLRNTAEVTTEVVTESSTQAPATIPSRRVE